MAQEELDVYRDWLGITETARPLDYYQLLRLARFEDNLAKIRDHYRKMNAHVRKFAAGEYASLSQQVLNELARAMLCLTDVQRKREYDASMGRKEEGEARRRTFEEILLANKVVDRDQLEKARSFAEAVGLDVRDAVLQQKMAGADVVTLAYAESLGLPYIELGDVGVDAELVPQVPPTTARQHSCVPVMVDQDQLLMASPNPLIPDVEEDLRLRFGMPVRMVLCTPTAINAVIAEYYPRDAATPAATPTPAKKTAAKAATPKPEAPPLTRDEQIKRRTMISVVTFNVVVVLYMLYRAVFTSGMDLMNYGSAAALAVLFGLVAAGIAFGITTLLKL